MWKVYSNSGVNQTVRSLYSISLKVSTASNSSNSSAAANYYSNRQANLPCSSLNNRHCFSTSANCYSKAEPVNNTTRNLFTSTTKSNFPEVATNLAEEVSNWESFPIPGTTAAAEAAGLVQGTVTEKKVWVGNDIFHSEELRSWGLRRGDPPMVQMGTLDDPYSTHARGGVSTEEISRIAQEFLGRDRFSTQFSLSHNFGQFRDIILLFLFKVSDSNHPVTHLTKILEREPQEGLGENQRNPYPLWRSMMLMLTAEMFNFPQDIQRLPTQIHAAIRDKHDRLGKIAEIVWIAHQLHRRIIDLNANIPVKRLKSVNVGGQVLQTVVEELENIEELHRANKATTLVGDLLLTQKCAHLAALKSPIVTELICNSLADYCEGDFDTGVVRPSPDYFTYEAWLTRSELGLGSLLGHCMYSALLFSGFDSSTRQQAFKLGSMLGVLNQAYEEVRFLCNANPDDNNLWVDLGTLPVIFQLKNDPSFLSKSQSEMLHSMVSTRSTLQKSLNTFEFMKLQTLNALSTCDGVKNVVPRDILMNFVQSLSPVDRK